MAERLRIVEAQRDEADMLYLVFRAGPGPVEGPYRDEADAKRTAAICAEIDGATAEINGVSVTYLAIVDPPERGEQ